MCDATYIGEELDLFSHATNWKRYLHDRLAYQIGGRVLEVGAGIGATTQALAGARGAHSWTCLEPDPALCARLQSSVASIASDVPITVVNGALDALAEDVIFDTILYIDVLEHIEDDREEVVRAVRHLAPGGRLIVLCPAFPFLYTPFDAAIGHFRRYTRRTLAAVAAPGTRQVASFYMDSVGMLASLANKLALRQTSPTPKQINLWDRCMVPVSRVADKLLTGLGKSVVLVWQKH